MDMGSTSSQRDENGLGEEKRAKGLGGRGSEVGTKSSSTTLPSEDGFRSTRFYKMSETSESSGSLARFPRTIETG